MKFSTGASVRIRGPGKKSQLVELKGKDLTMRNVIVNSPKGPLRYLIHMGSVMPLHKIRTF